jgi:hypothetical protein
LSENLKEKGIFQTYKSEAIIAQVTGAGPKLRNDRILKKFGTFIKLFILVKAENDTKYFDGFRQHILTRETCTVA